MPLIALKYIKEFTKLVFSSKSVKGTCLDLTIYPKAKKTGLIMNPINENRNQIRPTLVGDGHTNLLEMGTILSGQMLGVGVMCLPNRFIA